MDLYKIVTKRESAFIIGHRMDGAENFPTVISIEVINGSEPGSWVCEVKYSNGTLVKVCDVVELWNK